MRLIISKAPHGPHSHAPHGPEAQLKMAPSDRREDLRKQHMPPGAKSAAVLVLLTPPAPTPQSLLDWTVLLMRRAYAEHIGPNGQPVRDVHSGQIALPGGKAEEEDSGLWHTACREAYEEMGIREGDVEKVGRLTSLYVPPSNFAIHPFLALNRSVKQILPSPAEVVDYKFIPLRIFDPARAVHLDFSNRNGEERLAPAWQYEEYTIWGATAMILSELHALAVGGGLVVGE